MELMIKISQALKLLLIVALIIITPLLSTSLRTTYLYFIVHPLIISLGVEAGIISFFSKSPNHKIIPSSINIITQKQNNNMTTILKVMAFSPLGSSEQQTAPKAKYDIVNQERSHNKMDLGPNSTSKTNSTAEHCQRPYKQTNCHHTDRCGSGTTKMIAKNNTGEVVEKSGSEKNFGVGKVQQAAVKKCPSMPSLFFIGSSCDEENEVEQILKQEKYTDEKEEFGEIAKQELFHKDETFIGNFYKQLKMQREDSWKRLNDFYHNAAK